MPQTKTNVQELLDYNNSQAFWFSVHEQLPLNQIKRNLKFLRGLNGSSQITLEALEQLTEQEIKEALKDYKAPSEPTVNAMPAPATAAQFFHSLLDKSPYYSEIIPYPGETLRTPLSTQSPELSVSTQTISNTPKNNSMPVHGFHLNEKEAFSSTRFYSNDRRSYGRIIAKDGAFKATSHHLSPEQETDLTLEISFQFLLNLPPGHKSVRLNGSTPEVIHRLRAAFLYLQKESGTRYAELTFQLPDGMTIAEDELNDDYIQKHLGALNEPPRQITQLRDFLNLEALAPKIIDNSAPEPDPVPEPAPEPDPVPEKQNMTPIDFKRIADAPDLDQDDKKLLDEYRHYLLEAWAHDLNNIPENKKEYIAGNEKFNQRTIEAIRILSKAPSLAKELETLKTLYPINLKMLVLVSIQ